MSQLYQRSYTVTVPPSPHSRRPAADRRRGGVHRRPGNRRMIAAVTLVLAGLALVIAVPISRPLPPPAVTLTVPTSVTIPGDAPELPWPNRGQAAVAVDGLGEIGRFGGSRPVPIASVTKVMTAYVILTGHPLRAGEAGPTLTVSAAQAAAYPGEQARGESVVPVTAGARFTQREALQALMLPSANNMARILARWDAGSVDQFVAKMNTAAARLGMSHTRYTDPSGLDPGTVSTAADQIVLAQKAMAMPAFAEIVAQREATLPVAGTVTNYNTLIGQDGVVGVKTGSTDEAGGCLVWAATVRIGPTQLTIVGAVLGQPGDDTPTQLAAVFRASRALIRAATASLGVHPLLQAGQQVALVNGPLDTGTTLHADRPLKVIGWPGMTVQLRTDIPPVSASIASGARHGRVSWVTGDGRRTDVALRTSHELRPPSIWQRLTQML